VDLIVFTDRRQARRPLDEVVARAVDGGARTIVLREEDLPDGERRDLAERLRALLDCVGGRLLVAGTALPRPDGAHLSQGDGAVPGHFGRACHSIEELAAAAAEGAAYATLSPIFPTRSKPGYGPPLGLAALARMAIAVPVPVYALGGIDSAIRARDCLTEGATGVALMGAVMRAEDPARFVKELTTWP
jgi:thiamine-phosphate pyrophosphorylase